MKTSTFQVNTLWTNLVSIFMKRITRLLFLFLGLTMAYTVVGQSQSDLDLFNADRIDLTQNGMMVLGTWAVGNIVTSGLLTRNTTGEAQSFHQMNVMWNVVNAGIAGYGYFSLGEGMGLSLAETLSEQRSIENILLINAGLDVLYIAGGAGMNYYGRTREEANERLMGFGKSIMLQGAFLLAFDLGFYYFQANHREDTPWLDEHVEQAYIGPAGFGLTLNLD